MGLLDLLKKTNDLLKKTTERAQEFDENLKYRSPEEREFRRRLVVLNAEREEKKQKGLSKLEEQTIINCNGKNCGVCKLTLCCPKYTPLE